MRQRPTIEELVRRARDRDAFDEIARRVRPRLERYVRARMGGAVRGHVEPDDVIQETLLKAYGAIDRLAWRGEEAFYRWLGAIAEHVIWKASQHAARPLLSLGEEPAGEAPSPGQALAREERVRRLEKALQDLSPDHLQVIVLTRIEELKIAEAASRMGRSPNAVKKLLARALEDLRRRYGDTTGSLRLADRPLEIGGPSHAE